MAGKAISKKVRFEVFKRDSFKCQYCGASAPDVILEVDHIQPVAKRGKNDIMNLLTACKDCNAGKSDRLLDDSTEVVSIVRGILLKNIRYIDAEDGADMDATIRLCLRDGITRNQIINTARECRYATDVTGTLSWLHNEHTSGN